MNRMFLCQFLSVAKTNMVPKLEFPALGSKDVFCIPALGAQENRHQGRRQQWPCLVSEVSGSPECSGSKAYGIVNPNFDANKFATILVAFYHIQFMAVIFVNGCFIVNYGLKLLLFCDHPVHQAAPVECFLWQCLRCLAAFATTFGALWCCSSGCKRRLYLVGKRRLSRKIKARHKSRNLSTLFFIALILDGNIVNAAMHNGIAEGSLESSPYQDSQEEQGGIQRLRLSDNRTCNWHEAALGQYRTMDIQQERMFWPTEDWSWAWYVTETLYEDNVIECLEEGRVVYLKTWLMDHQVGRQHGPRTIRLREQDEMQEWRTLCYETWSDLIPWRNRFDIYVVQSRPPRIRFDEATTDHLILSLHLQDPNRRFRTAGIVSFISNGEVQRQCIVATQEETSTHDILIQSGLCGDERSTGGEYNIDGTPTSYERRGYRHATSWNFVDTIEVEQDDQVSLGQIYGQTIFVKSCKPNPGIILDHDDNVPLDLVYQNGTPVQGRTIPPPYWHRDQTLLAAANSDAVRRGTDTHLRVYLRTWFLGHDKPPEREPRDLAMRAQLMVNVAARIRHEWRDKLERGDTIRLLIVTPTPADGAGHVPRLHIIVEVNRPGDAQTLPILLSYQRLARGGPDPRTYWIVVAAHQPLTLLDAAEISETLRPQDLMVPMGTSDRRWMGLMEHRVIRAGLYIPIWWRDTEPQHTETTHPAEEDDDPSLFQTKDQSKIGNTALWNSNTVENDQVSFMQSQAAHTVGGRANVRLIGLHGLTGLVTVDPERTLTEQLGEVWPFQETSRDQVSTTYRVIEPLTYATAGPEQVYIVELRGDHFEQIHDDDVLTLVTIRFINEVSNRNKLRVRVLWTPAHATRAAFMQWLRLHWICRRGTVLCHVYVNGETWGEMDTTIRQFHSGDHCRVQIRSAREDWCDLEHIETTENHSLKPGDSG